MITIMYDKVLAKDFYEYQDVIKLIKRLEEQGVLTINKEVGIDILRKNSSFLRV